VTRTVITQVIRDVLLQRALPGGGLTDRPQGRFRVDATAWGAVAIAADGGEDTICEKLCARLVDEQQNDGRVSVSKSHPESYWPTPIAVLAWQNSSPSRAARDKSIHFLLSTTGNHFAHRADEPAGHDTSLKGWPWVAGTHSWIEPTAMSMIALKATGYSRHDRVSEAVRMLLDRQLLHGGWNHGNSFVYGRELRPTPDGTGAALAALAGMVDRHHVPRAIDYLQGERDRLRTPISLGWTLIGLAAWNLWPSNGLALVERCLVNQLKLGEYDTSSLSLLLLGALAGHPDDSMNVFGFRRAG
jgi:hypothetical protein